MSAYMVNREHIDALVELAIYGPRHEGDARFSGGEWRTGGEGLRWWTVDATTLRTVAWDDMDIVRRYAVPDTADNTGAMLIAENLASIHHRYPDTLGGGSIPGPIAAYWDERYVFRHVSAAPSAVEGLKLIFSYEYQSCEHRLWPSSEAQSFCHELRSRLIHELDGYAEAPWSWPGQVEGRA